MTPLSILPVVLGLLVGSSQAMTTYSTEQAEGMAGGIIALIVIVVIGIPVACCICCCCCACCPCYRGSTVHNSMQSNTTVVPVVVPQSGGHPGYPGQPGQMQHTGYGPPSGYPGYTDQPVQAPNTANPGNPSGLPPQYLSEGYAKAP